MAFRKAVSRAMQQNIIDNAEKILSDFSRAWEGNDVCPYQFRKQDGNFIVKDGDTEYSIHMVVVNNG